MPLIFTGVTLSACLDIQNNWPFMNTTPEMETTLQKPTLAMSPGTFIGLDQSAVRDLMGKPGAERKVSAATVWSYKTNECSIDIFFYQDLKTKTYRVLSYDAKAAKGPKDDEVIKSCIGRIREENLADRT
ncbi:MAG: hypothetical protein WD407_03450 [Rhodospirillales bacterium]